MYKNLSSSHDKLRQEAYAGIFALNRADLNFDELFILTISGCSDIEDVAKISWNFMENFILPNLKNNFANSVEEQLFV